MYINQTCDNEKKEQSNALTIQNLGGVFVVLIGGIVIAMVIAVFEFIYYAWTKRDLPVRTNCCLSVIFCLCLSISLSLSLSLYVIVKIVKVKLSRCCSMFFRILFAHR